MCGIIGQKSINNLPISPPLLKTLKHRGPDGEGEWINEGRTVYIGHTRLAIVDLTEAGHQPMSDAKKRFTITFNGEIYNHLELRKILPDVHWRGSSDTETLVELLAHEGISTLPKLKGMFAFALHDAIDDSILLVRDRFGMKPLWVKSDENYFSFSSEVRPLLNLSKSSLSISALSEYIGFGHLPAKGEVFEGIQAISPGGWMKLYGKDKKEEGLWWPNSSFSLPKIKNNVEWRLRVKQLVNRAVEEHLMSDVGIGVFLSGGIDSSIIATIAGKHLGKKLKSFTVGFPNVAFDERAIAKRVAIRAGCEHYELEINENTCLEWIKEAVNSLDVPSVDAINTFIVAKSVRDAGLKVALSGLGGDELFGGYPSFQSIPWLTWLGVLPDRLSKQIVNIMPRNLKEKLRKTPNFTTSELAIARRRFTSFDTLINMGLKAGSPSIPTIPVEFDTMGKISWAEMQGYMIPMLLRDSDQMSMAVGLELRVPFLDHCLVEEVLQIPQKYKQGKGVKPLLVEAFQDELPQEVYQRPKQGFGLPMEEWIRGPLSEFTNEGIFSAADLLNMHAPLHQKKAFEQGTQHWTRVWHWCILGHWLKNNPTFMDNK